MLAIQPSEHDDVIKQRSLSRVDHTAGALCETMPNQQKRWCSEVLSVYGNLNAKECIESKYEEINDNTSRIFKTDDDIKSATQMKLYINNRKKLKYDCQFETLKKEWESFSKQLFETTSVFRKSHFTALQAEGHVKRVSSEWHIDMRAWWEYESTVLERKIKLLQEHDLINVLQ